MRLWLHPRFRSFKWYAKFGNNVLVWLKQANFWDRPTSDGLSRASLGLLHSLQDLNAQHNPGRVIEGLPEK
jgi:hypothetical protein